MDDTTKQLHDLADTMAERLADVLTDSGLDALDDIEDMRAEYERWNGPDELTHAFDKISGFKPQTQNRIREAIVDAIAGRAEGLLDDEGVDEEVCREIADDILEIMAAAPPNRLMAALNAILEIDANENSEPDDMADALCRIAQIASAAVSAPPEKPPHICVVESGGICTAVFINGVEIEDYERLDWDCQQVGEPVEISDQARALLPADIVDAVDKYNASLAKPE